MGFEAFREMAPDEEAVACFRRAKIPPSKAGEAAHGFEHFYLMFGTEAP